MVLPGAKKQTRSSVADHHNNLVRGDKGTDFCCIIVELLWSQKERINKGERVSIMHDILRGTVENEDGGDFHAEP